MRSLQNGSNNGSSYGFDCYGDGDEGDGMGDGGRGHLHKDWLDRHGDGYGSPDFLDHGESWELLFEGDGP